MPISFASVDTRLFRRHMFVFHQNEIISFVVVIFLLKAISSNDVLEQTMLGLQNLAAISGLICALLFPAHAQKLLLLVIITIIIFISGIWRSHVIKKVDDISVLAAVVVMSTGLELIWTANITGILILTALTTTKLVERSIQDVVCTILQTASAFCFTYCIYHLGLYLLVSRTTPMLLLYDIPRLKEIEKETLQENDRLIDTIFLDKQSLMEVLGHSAAVETIRHQMRERWRKYRAFPHSSGCHTNVSSEDDNEENVTHNRFSRMSKASAMSPSEVGTEFDSVVFKAKSLFLKENTIYISDSDESLSQSTTYPSYSDIVHTAQPQTASILEEDTKSKERRRSSHGSEVHTETWDSSTNHTRSRRCFPCVSRLGRIRKRLTQRQVSSFSSRWRSRLRKISSAPTYKSPPRRAAGGPEEIPSWFTYILRGLWMNQFLLLLRVETEKINYVFSQAIWTDQELDIIWREHLGDFADQRIELWFRAWLQSTRARLVLANIRLIGIYMLMVDTVILLVVLMLLQANIAAQAQHQLTRNTWNVTWIYVGVRCGLHILICFGLLMRINSYGMAVIRQQVQRSGSVSTSRMSPTPLQSDPASLMTRFWAFQLANPRAACRIVRLAGAIVLCSEVLSLVDSCVLGVFLRSDTVNPSFLTFSLTANTLLVPIVLPMSLRANLICWATTSAVLFGYTATLMILSFTKWSTQDLFWQVVDLALSRMVRMLCCGAIFRNYRLLFVQHVLPYLLVLAGLDPFKTDDTIPEIAAKPLPIILPKDGESVDDYGGSEAVLIISQLDDHQHVHEKSDNALP